MTRSPNIRQVLEALEFARREVFRTGSPDFLRARVGEDRVQRLCERLIRGKPIPLQRHRATEKST